MSEDVVIIGAGPAGRAGAACLKERGVAAAILEKAECVGSVWRRHYDRLHLHTNRGNSGLPGLKMPSAYGRYPARAQVVEYFDDYAAHHGLKPQFGVTVGRVRRDGALRRIEAGDASGPARAVVIAAGMAEVPQVPAGPGQADCGGVILHSSLYRNPAPYKGKRVLVVGFGNSGGEIALDLAEAGVTTAISVRGPVRVLPRDLFGIPILSFAIAQRLLPARVSDAINAPVVRLATGSIEKLGLKMAAKGPRRMIEEDGRVPLLDVGTLAKIRSGAILVRPGVKSFSPGKVTFDDGKVEPFDAVILATGFKPDLRNLLPDDMDALDASGAPRMSGRESAPGLYFCGAKSVVTGVLREIGIEATRIAEDIANRPGRAAP